MQPDHSRHMDRSYLPDQSGLSDQVWKERLAETCTLIGAKLPIPI